MFFKSRKDNKFKTWQLIVLGVMIVTALSFRIYSTRWSKAVVTILGRDYKVLVADTYAHQFQGLGGRDNLEKYQGMLFIFNNSGQHTMVMRDMRFNIDIVWLDNGVIIDMAPNVEVELGKKEAELTPYFARSGSNMVLELPAGFIQERGLKIGDSVKITR